MKLRELINELDFPSVSQAIDNFKFFSNPQQPSSGQSATPAPTTQKTSTQSNQQVQPTPQQQSKPVATAKAEPASFNPATSKDLLINIARKMGVVAVNDLAQLIGNVQIETGNWVAATENFMYTDPERIHKVFTSNFPSVQTAVPYVGNQVALANRAYANKNGNGDEASGDGWRYRGRGFLHITGKANYAKVGAGVHPENPSIYVTHPELLSSNPVESAKASVWYFTHVVGKGKSAKQVARAVTGNSVMKQKERGQAADAAKQSLVKSTPKKGRKPA